MEPRELPPRSQATITNALTSRRSGSYRNSGAMVPSGLLDAAVKFGFEERDVEHREVLGCFDHVFIAGRATAFDFIYGM